MEIAKAYLLLKKNINAPLSDFYKYSNETPYDYGIKALDYYRYYGGKPLNIEKTYLNRHLMPIFEDLDLFQLDITNIFLKIKESQDKFNGSEALKDLMSLSKTISILSGKSINEYKSFIKKIVNGIKSTRKDIDEYLKDIFINGKILLYFFQFMERREIKAQDTMEKLIHKFKNNSYKVSNLKFQMRIEDKLLDLKDDSDEKFKQKIEQFQKNLVRKGRIVKIERLKMKINDMQINLENEIIKNNDITKIKRKINFLGSYKYNPDNHKNDIQDKDTKNYNENGKRELKSIDNSDNINKSSTDNYSAYLKAITSKKTS